MPIQVEALLAIDLVLVLFNYAVHKLVGPDLLASEAAISTQANSGLLHPRSEVVIKDGCDGDQAVLVCELYPPSQEGLRQLPNILLRLVFLCGPVGNYENPLGACLGRYWIYSPWVSFLLRVVPLSSA